MTLLPRICFGLMIPLITGCSMVLSAADEVKSVHLHGQDINKAVTPEGFVVSVREISEVVPITKYAWNIYADRQNYYVSAAIQKVVSRSGDNSHLAKRNGIRIKGTDRGDLIKLQRLIHNRQYRNFEYQNQMRRALGQEG